MQLRSRVIAMHPLHSTTIFSQELKRKVLSKYKLYLSDDNQKGYIEARLKDLYSVGEKADPEYLELQRHYMRVGRLNAIAFFTRAYRNQI